MLENCIQGLQKLDDGRIEPKTAMQVHFVSVCRGKVPPVTRYEKAYLRWRHSKPSIPDMIPAEEPNVRVVPRVVVKVNKKKAARWNAKKRNEYRQKLSPQQLSGPNANNKKRPTRTAIYTYE